MNSVPIEPRITEYLYRKAAFAGVPLSGTFELTPLCNMNCKMCYVKLSEKEQKAAGELRTAAEWIALAKELKNDGMLYLLLTGGEPFLHPEIREIIKGLHELGLLITINSNGTLIDEKTVEWLKKYPPVRINISLYGKNNETYERLCGNKNGFSQTERAIKLLKEAGIPLKLNCSVTPHNADDLEGIADFANKNGLVLSAATYMFPPVRRDSTMTGKNDRFSPETAAYYAAFAEYLTLGKERFLKHGDNIKISGDPDDNCASVGEGIGCRAGKCSFWVTWQGYLTPCGMFPTDKENNVFKKGFNACWQAVKAKTAAIRLPKECAGCDLKQSCHACAAMVITESGSFDTLPEYRCKMSKAYPYEYKKLAEKLREDVL